MKEYPRIYNLFPRRAGTIDKWEEHLPRISSMGFNWVWVNPYQETGKYKRPSDGKSGSLYATYDHSTVDPDFSKYQKDHHCSPKEAAEHDHKAIAHFVEKAHEQHLKVMTELVANHVALDSPLVEGKDPRYPGSEKWFKHNSDGSLYIVSENRWQWDDVAQFNFDDPQARKEIVRFLKERIDDSIVLGFDGFRCDAARLVPVEVWKELIDHGKQKRPDSLWMGELLGGTWEDYQPYRNAGFDNVTNSIAYAFDNHKSGGLVAPWFLGERKELLKIAPAIGFPESHDTQDTTVSAMENPGFRENRDAALQLQLQRYAMSTLMSDGVIMPMGYERGITHKLNVFKHPAPTWKAVVEKSGSFNIESHVQQINALAAQYIKPGSDGIMEILPIENHPSHLLIRRQATGSRAEKKAESIALILEQNLGHPKVISAEEYGQICHMLGRKLNDIKTLSSSPYMTILECPSLKKEVNISGQSKTSGGGGGPPQSQKYR